MQNPIYIGIIENVAILVAIAVLYDFIWLKFEKRRKFFLQLILGLLVAGIGIILMRSPWTLVEGIVFDTRSVLLTISGLFFGGVTTIVALIGTALYRIYMGGSGVYMGVAVIITSSLISLVWRKFRPKLIKEKRIDEVYLVAVVVHLIMLGCTIFLPQENRISTLSIIWWPVIVIYPAATTLIAMLLFNREKNWEMREKIEESEKRYRLIAEYANDLIYIYRLKPTPGFEYVSPSATRITGYTPEEHYADPQLGFKIVHPEDKILLESFFINQNFNKPIILRWKKKDGTIIWTEQHNVPIYDEYGDLVSIHGIARDITERKLIDERILQKETELREIFNSSIDSIQIDDIETGRIIDCNDRTLEMYGFTKEELLNGHISDLSANIEPYTEKRAQELIQKTINGKPQTFEWLARKKSNELFWVEVRLQLAEIAGKKRVIATVRDISDKKKVQKELIESEQRFLRVIHFAKDAIGILDSTFKFVECNDAAAQMHGFRSRTELLAQSLHPSMLSPDLQPDGQNSFEKANRMINVALEQGSNRFEWLHKRLDGKTFWAEVTLTPIFFREQQMVYAVWRDITEQKQKQQRIENLSQIIENSLNEIYVFKADDLRFIEANNAALDNLGYAKEELLELTPLDIKPHLSAKDFKEIINSLIDDKASKVVFESSHRRKDGTEYPVEVQLQRIKFGEYDAFVATMVDITQRKADQQKLIQREQEFREIYNSTQEAILIFDAHNISIADCNDRAVEMYGYQSKEELLACSIYDLGANIEPYTNDKVGYWTQKAITEGPQRFDWLAKKKNGEVFWVEVSLKRTIIGGMERDLTVVRDISERKKYEEELIKAKEKAEESDRLKSSFLANLSHEIRTPMNAIMGFTDLMKQPVSEDKTKEYIDIIQKSGQRLLDIISDTIEIAKLDTGIIKPNPEVFDVNLLMKDIYLEMKLRTKSNKDLEIILLNNNLESPVNIYTDKVKLQQILTNLIVNGIKYTPRGAVAFSYEITGNRIAFKVQDTGIGIEKKHRELIFKRFYRVENPLTIKAGGIGLGLAITKAYTELLGGNIEIQSEIGKGTTVTVSIPYHTAEPSTDIFISSPDEKIKGKQELILVAEDDEYNFLFINEILKQSEYRCMRAANGQEAVDIVRKNEDVKLVLMDIKMPVKDGYKAFAEIKEFKPDIPIIAQTAYALGEDKNKILRYGFDGYLSKPIRKQELLTLVQKKLKR